jgi:hypothetical protein
MSIQIFIGRPNALRASCRAACGTKAPDEGAKASLTASVGCGIGKMIARKARPSCRGLWSRTRLRLRSRESREASEGAMNFRGVYSAHQFGISSRPM